MKVPARFAVTPARLGRWLAGGLAVLICLGGVWGRCAGVPNAGAMACTLLAALVLAVSLVLAVTSQPRRR